MPRPRNQIEGQDEHDNEMQQVAEKKTNKVEAIKRALIEALQKNLGVVTASCKAVGVDRATFYRYVNSDPEFAAEVKSMDDFVLDFAESSLHKQIREGNTTATIFFLKTKGKKRGYIERQELTGKDGQALNEPQKTDYSKLSTKELEQLYGLLRKANTD